MAIGERTSLDCCGPGQQGRVLGIRQAGRIRQRLLEMGLVEGTPVEVVRLAPLGDPVEVRLRSYLLSLRRSEAAAVELEVVA